ncbi:carboxypeptidase regulatory-like domain-containing protein [Segatella copri]|uniref:carboxypeptidase regulatory-like domain-containing protein n=1 Tax=Segatella copri TaxID=165179 RepID=UPI0022E220E1|nr:carboxypeptidase regulatory-like domain-containing protein [Segatella copri]
MKGKIVSFILLAFISITPAYSQSTIKGTIVDSLQVGIPYAAVKVLKMDSTFVKGVAADSIGCFQTSVPQEGKYILIANSLGYDSKVQIVEANNVSSSVITLTPNSIALHDVVVRGSSITRKDTHLQIIPDKQIYKHTNNGYDLLYDLMIPNLQIDRQKGTVTTIGGTVTLYIDGRKVEYHEVKGLKSKDILKVEYYDVPTGKYAGDYASINIITRPMTTGGYISVDGTQQLAYQEGDYNLAAKVAHGSTSFTIFGGYNRLHYDADKIEREEFFHFDNNEISRSYSSYEGVNKQNQEYVQLNILTKKKKYMLSEKLSLVRKENPINQTNGILFANTAQTSTAQCSTNTSSSLMPRLSLYGNIDVTDKQYVELSLSGTYGRNKYSNMYKDEKLNTNTIVKEDYYSANFYGKYGIIFPHKNSLSFHLGSVYMNTMSQYMGTYEAWQHQWSSQNYAFVEYVQQFDKWRLRLKPGASALYYHTKDADAVSHYIPQLQSTIFWQPTKSQQVSLDILFSNAYPTSSSLNTAEQIIDDLRIKRGNENLRPMDFYQGTVNYNIQIGSKINITSFSNFVYQHHQYVETYYEENGKLINSMDDHNNSRGFIEMLSLSWKATDNLRLKIDGVYNHTDVWGKFRTTFNSWRAYMNVNYYCNEFAFRIWANTKGKEMILPMITVEHVPVNYGGSINWNHKDWSFEVGTVSPFHKNNEFIETLNVPVYNSQEHIISSTNRKFYIQAAYTFNFGKKIQKDWKNIDMNVNSAILKAK